MCIRVTGAFCVCLPIDGFVSYCCMPLAWILEEYVTKCVQILSPRNVVVIIIIIVFYFK